MYIYIYTHLIYIYAYIYICICTMIPPERPPIEGRCMRGIVNRVEFNRLIRDVYTGKHSYEMFNRFVRGINRLESNIFIQGYDI